MSMKSQKVKEGDTEPPADFPPECFFGKRVAKHKKKVRSATRAGRTLWPLPLGRP